jgi:pyruvate dehydrogenase E2 component (dihydrolipoamide acetyltransferase)
MIQNIELPDIGDFDEVEVIEILISVGDTIDEEQSIMTLESDKASMEIPTPIAGVVKSVEINLGDKISQGSLLITLGTESNIQNTTNKTETETEQTTSCFPIKVPDIGDFDEVEVIEILVNVGDKIDEEQSIITLESDKASMEIPTPMAGVVKSIQVSLGDKIALNDVILELQGKQKNSTPDTKITEQAKPAPASAPSLTQQPPAQKPLMKESHASPSIRKLARELEIDLSQVRGTGAKNRVLDSDLKQHIKQIISAGSASGSLPKTPVIDFSKFGETTTLPLSRINKLSGKHLSACWLNIPHVTQFDEVSIDEMETFRQAQKAKGVKLTPLVFIMKAVVQALKAHPRLNASLDETQENLILKHYFHLGIAMDTPNGLVVPVVRDVDQKSLTELATELAQTSAKAREGKLSPADMQGAGFTISSLGGIGGTQFTPIVNAPEVAILGISRSQIKPIWNGKEFAPTLRLPLALSYDHRVIDGAQGGRFMADLNAILQDIREILL